MGIRPSITVARARGTAMSHPRWPEGVVAERVPTRCAVLRRPSSGTVEEGVRQWNGCAYDG